MRNINILHLSDLHYNSTREKDQKIIIDALCNDLKILRDEENINLDFVIFSGDLVIAGDNLRDFQKAKEEFIDPLLLHARLNTDNLFITPGNHDVQKSKVHQIVENGLKATLKDRTEVNKLLDELDDNLICFDRLQNYNNFKKQIDSSYNVNSNILFSTYIIKKEEYINGLIIV